jgi:hypothetical protein
MTTPPTPPGWRVFSLTVIFGGSLEIEVQAPDQTTWHVSISRDGDWSIFSSVSGIPKPAERSAIMATVSAYAI